MAESDKEFSGSIPELYDTYLVPLLFEAYANDLAERVAALAPKTVLETAAGTGVGNARRSFPSCVRRLLLRDGPQPADA